MANRPFSEVLATATLLTAQGADVYQKFTCSNCGQRLTMEEPNKFWEVGHCDNCGRYTDIKHDGCNYFLYHNIRDKTPRHITVVKSTKE